MPLNTLDIFKALSQDPEKEALAQAAQMVPPQAPERPLLSDLSDPSAGSAAVNYAKLLPSPEEQVAKSRAQLELQMLGAVGENLANRKSAAHYYLGSEPQRQNVSAFADKAAAAVPDIAQLKRQELSDRQAMEEVDPNSGASNIARSVLSKAGVRIPPGMSAAQIKSMSPLLGQIIDGEIKKSIFGAQTKAANSGKSGLKRIEDSMPDNEKAVLKGLSELQLKVGSELPVLNKLLKTLRDPNVSEEQKRMISLSNIKLIGENAEDANKKRIEGTFFGGKAPISDIEAQVANKIQTLQTQAADAESKKQALLQQYAGDEQLGGMDAAQRWMFFESLGK